MLVTKYKLIIIFLFLFTSFAESEILQKEKLDKLFYRLSKTYDYNNANLLEKKIWAVWHKHPNNESLTDKLKLGTDSMYEGNFKYALQVFTNIIITDPSWAEAWNKRATLLFFMNQYQRSLSDIDTVLHLEPRHFGALSGRAQIFIELKEYEKAIKDLKKIKKIHPTIKGNDTIPKLGKLIKNLSV